MGSEDSTERLLRSYNMGFPSGLWPDKSSDVPVLANNPLRQKKVLDMGESRPRQTPSLRYMPIDTKRALSANAHAWFEYSETSKYDGRKKSEADKQALTSLLWPVYLEVAKSFKSKENDDSDYISKTLLVLCTCVLKNRCGRNQKKDRISIPKATSLERNNFKVGRRWGDAVEKANSVIDSWVGEINSFST